MVEVIKTLCLCGFWCGINVYVEDGKIVKIEGMPEHPVNRGAQCPKGTAAIEWVHSPDRLKYPMKREGSHWERITWDEALDTVATRLTEIKETYGAKALVVLRGMGASSTEPIAGWDLRRRFCDVYGTPNYSSVDSMCFWPHMMAYNLTYGRYYGPDTPTSSNMIVLWGKDADHSGWMLARKIRQAKATGAKLAVIDPRRIRLAKEADFYLQPRPGTDAALALGMLNVIISENLYDAEFVNEWAVGFDKLVEHVKGYPLEEVEKITWVPAAKIRELAEAYATTKPACIHQAGSALDQQASGFHVARAICILQAITGNLDVPGGFMVSRGLPMRLDYRCPELLKERPIGEDIYPMAYKVYGRPIGEGQGNLLLDAIVTQNPYPIKALIADATNPLSAWANANKWREARGKLDFVVATSMFPSETTEIADLVLPGASPLEVDEVSFYSGLHQLPFVMARRKVMQYEECWSSGNFWLQLAKRMGYDRYFPWESTNEFINWVLEPSKLTIESLMKEHPSGYFYGSNQYGRYKEKGFLTPSKKVEIYSDTMAKLGLDPLPVHIEPTESLVSDPELAKEYPLMLMTGARTIESNQSQMHNLPRLRKLARENCVAQIHPDTANEYGIGQGEMMTVETKRGSIEIKAKVTEDILPGLISVPVGWAHANANKLTFEKPGGAVIGVPQFKALLCKVSRVKSP